MSIFPLRFNNFIVKEKNTIIKHGGIYQLKCMIQTTGMKIQKHSYSWRLCVLFLLCYCK